jgi:hypothetical protein
MFQTPTEEDRHAKDGTIQDGELVVENWRGYLNGSLSMKTLRVAQEHWKDRIFERVGP